MSLPIIIRNWADGREYELASVEAFQRVYGDDPSWFIASPPALAHPDWVALGMPASAAEVASVLADGTVGGGETAP